MLDFAGDSEEGHFVTTSCGTFDLEVVAVIHPETLETLNEQEIDRCELGRADLRGEDTEPNRTSPVTVSTKHAAFRVSRPVFDFKFLAVDDITEWFPIRRRGVFLR
jgi:hypothetical protein